MKQMEVCPSCHSETPRLVHCFVSRRLVCAEICALTDVDFFFLNMFEQPAVAEHPLAESSVSRARRFETGRHPH
jgi:hypothetical protein